MPKVWEARRKYSKDPPKTAKLIPWEAVSLDLVGQYNVTDKPGIDMTFFNSMLLTYYPIQKNIFHNEQQYDFEIVSLWSELLASVA